LNIEDVEGKFDVLEILEERRFLGMGGGSLGVGCVAGSIFWNIFIEE
jgi:hypothetical protein